ncbi:MAG: hypothetical protein ACJ8GJ_02940 [Vitreoscilla sp.]
MGVLSRKCSDIVFRIKFAATMSAGQWPGLASGEYPYRQGFPAASRRRTSPKREIGDFPHYSEIDFMRDLFSTHPGSELHVLPVPAAPVTDLT